jgi:acetyl esterase/lipase
MHTVIRSWGELRCGGWFLSCSMTLLLLLLELPVGGQTRRPDSSNVEYAFVDGVHLKLDVYLPRNAPKPYSVVVWIHGGAWMAGAKENTPATFLLCYGYAIVSVNYRLSRQALFPAQVHDCKAAVRWVRGNAAAYGLDPHRIGVWGSSAGGHLAALLGTAGPEAGLEGTLGGERNVSTQVQAVCDWYGPTNLVTIWRYPSTINRAASSCPEAKLIGGSLQRNSEKAWKASPMAYVKSGDPPFLIMHGTVDSTVPFHQSVELDSALHSAGVPVLFKPITGAGHGGPAFTADSTRQLVRTFFDAHLKKRRRIHHDGGL